MEDCNSLWLGTAWLRPSAIIEICLKSAGSVSDAIAIDKNIQEIVFSIITWNDKYVEIEIPHCLFYFLQICLWGYTEILAIWFEQRHVLKLQTLQPTLQIAVKSLSACQIQCHTVPQTGPRFYDSPRRTFAIWDVRPDILKSVDRLFLYNPSNVL